MRAAVAEGETGLKGGRRHVDKHAIGDGLCAGIAKDDLSEKALEAVCLVDSKLLMQFVNPPKRRQAFCVPKGWRGQGRQPNLNQTASLKLVVNK